MIQRLKNLWRLSAYEPRTIGSPPAPAETQIIQLIKNPQEKAQFIPRIKKTPLEQINEASQ